MAAPVFLKLRSYDINLAMQFERRLRRLSRPAVLLRFCAQLIAAAGLLLLIAVSPAQADVVLENEEASPRLMRLGDATTGALMLKSQTPGQFIEAPRLATDVIISVSGPIARTRVTQRFENATAQWVEGVYVFPLPDEAAVDTLKMQIGDRFIEGTIEEKKKAKAVYEAAKKAGKKASLLVQNRSNIFTNSVANIGPGETVIVQIEYQESVKLEDDVFSLRFPMVVAPRYNPPAQIMNVSFEGGGWGTVDPVADRDRITPPVLHPANGPANPVSLTVDLNAGFALGDVASSYHAVSKTFLEDGHMRVSLAEGDVPADKDFELRWSPDKTDAPAAALFKETISGEPYYLLLITPPTDKSASKRIAREVTFVIDTSGSMGGISIRQARASLEAAVKRLKSDDVFNIIAFNSDHTALFSNPQSASERNVNRALLFVRKLQAGGGTEMLPALQDALVDHGTAGDRLRQVVFLTDGAIGNEKQLFETIAAGRGDARIFTVGIGSAPNSFFMSRAAELGQGAFTHIGSVGEVADRMAALFTKLETPAVTNLQARWPDGTVAEVWPAPIPDLYEGETLVVAARAATETGTLWVSGEQDGRPWKAALPLEAAAVRKGVSKLWARKKIASLELARARQGVDRDALDASILDVALSHHLITRLTSLVAVDVTPSRPAGDAVIKTEIPLNLPQGWDFEAVFGPGEKGRLREAALNPLSTRAGLSKAHFEGDIAPAPTGRVQDSIVLPQGASLADVKLLIGLAMIGLALALLFMAVRPYGNGLADADGYGAGER